MFWFGAFFIQIVRFNWRGEAWHVDRLCYFKDEMKTSVRELAERTFDEHSFKAYL